MKKNKENKGKKHKNLIRETCKEAGLCLSFSSGVSKASQYPHLQAFIPVSNKGKEKRE